MRAKKRYEEEIQRRAEEEQRIAEMLEEARLADPDAPIEHAQEVVYKRLMEAKMEKKSEEMS